MHKEFAWYRDELEWKGKCSEAAFSKFRRAVRVKITIEDRKRGNMVAKFKREKTVSGRRRTDEEPHTPLCPKELCGWSSPTCEMHTPYEGRQGPCI